MTEPKPRQGSGRTQLFLIALIFAVPLLGAIWLYYGENAPRPEGRSNHGALLTPVISLADELGDSPLLAATADHWALVYVQRGPCDTDCEDALFRMRQSRLMLGNDMSRVRRVLLHGLDAPDTLFLEEEHAGLVALQDPTASQALGDSRPRNLGAGGLYLIDPLGNLVMYFPDDISPRQLVDDIEHLLELSRIG